MMNYTIGNFARKTGLSAYTLRYYEKEHLLAPQRQPNGRRFYTEQDLAWVDFIKRLKETGMPLKQIQQYAQLRAQGPNTMLSRKQMLMAHHQHIETTIKQWQTHLEKMNQKIAFYDRKINHVKTP